MGRLANPAFPRSAAYDDDWVLGGIMGPNPMWLVEWLVDELHLEPGMRVLDLGCGRALTSVFLARELGVHVVAADLWIGPDENWARIQEAGQGERVMPVLAEAHDLPFAKGYFDAIVSIDAYQYFGTDVLYLHYVSRFLRPGGRLGVVMPGLMQPLPRPMPEHLVRPQANGHVFWESECASFRTVDWWRAHLAECDRVTVDLVDAMPDGWRHWRDHERTVEGAPSYSFPSVEETLEADRGAYLGFVRAVCTRVGGDGMNLYQPELAAKL
jgi:cyclopropane fatty-acyl-phospholipid synthase-like methyltransferase